MEIELVEIRDFLACHSPFDLLSTAQLNDLPGALTVRYLRRDSPFPPAQCEGACIVRSGAVTLHDEQGQLCEKLGEGDLYSAHCEEGEQEVLHGTTTEDTLFYTLPCSRLAQLCTDNLQFAHRVQASLRERLRQAARLAQESGDELGAMHLAISELIQRPPIQVSTEVTIQQAAQLMTKHNISSLLITEGDTLRGVVTDSDLRRRCVAEALAVSEPVTRVMSERLVTIQSHELLSEALMVMTRLNVHHLPVLEGTTLRGMLTTTDLARHQSANSAFITAELHRATCIEDLVRAMARLPNLLVRLSQSSVTAAHIGEAVAHITDALTCRLLKLAEQQLGPPPVPYLWLCGGSQARGEQTSHSDQDNALLISDDWQPEHEAYFAALAEQVCNGLHQCGFVYCPGQAMANNPQWRQPLRVWLQYFHDWIARPQPKALMLSSIFFDLRAVYGEETLFHQLQQSISIQSRKNQIFLAYMVANALTHRPPLGFFRHFALIHDGKHDDTFDIKHRGIVPIIDIARVLALAGGITEVNTRQRLQAAAKAEILSTEMKENLQDALEFIATLRIQHQVWQMRQGHLPDNYLPPTRLSQLERKHLKDAFKVIQTMQSVLEQRYQVGRLV